MGYEIPSDHHQSLPPKPGDPHPRDPSLEWNGFEYVPKRRSAKVPPEEGYSYADTIHPSWQVQRARTIEDNIADLLLSIEFDPQGGLREGLLETPARVAKAWQHWTSGYSKNAADILKVFEDGAEGVDEMVVVRDIPIYSHCEHHLAPIFGTATIGYLPQGKIVGLSKLNRLADMFARRLQVQERMTNQIADALMEHLGPKGCGVVVNARHMCMESRGVCQSSNTVTSALRGNFKDDATVRAEFLALARN